MVAPEKSARSRLLDSRLASLRSAPKVRTVQGHIAKVCAHQGVVVQGLDGLTGLSMLDLDHV
jgi:hypothetical protein